MREAEGSVMHGNHPSRIQIEEGARGVTGAGVNIAELRRIVGANWQERDLRAETSADLAKTGKIRSIAGVINGVLAAAQDVATVSAVRIAQNARTPVAGWYVRDGYIAMAVAAPPIQFNDIAETKIGHKIKHMFRDHRSRA